MHRVASFAPLVLALACAGASKKEDGPKPEGEPSPEAGDDGAKPPPEPTPSTEPIPCGDKSCTPPEQCITVVGSLANAPSTEECWIPCGNDGEANCPEGMECAMIHDGPGQVCVKTD